jgi:hypothetical protein
MRAPPTRYRIVERGRRLEVIDTWTGAPASRAAGGPRLLRPADALAPAEPAQEGAGIADGSSFTTRPWYDDKAPRRIRTDFAIRKQIEQLGLTLAVAIALGVAFLFLFWPFSALLLGAAAFAARGMRPRLRAAATRFVDRLDQAARVTSQRG